MVVDLTQDEEEQQQQVNEDEEIDVEGGICLICHEGARFTLLCTKTDREGNKIKTVCDMAYCEQHVRGVQEMPAEKFAVVLFV